MNSQCGQLLVGLDSSVGRALHWLRKSHEFESCPRLNFL